MKKIFITLTLSILTMLCLTATVFAAKPFNDVPTTHWAYKYVNPMVDKGVINGYDGNVFKPNGNVTRAEWAKLLAVTAGIPTHEDYKEIMENACVDAKPDVWHAPYTVALLPYFDYEMIESAEDSGKHFRCESSKAVTRLEIAKSVIKVAGFDTSEANLDYIKGFRDYTNIPEADRKYAAVAVEKGIINGFDDNTFRPYDNVTRAQAATILHRTFYGEIYEIEQPEKPYIIEKLIGNVKITNSIEATLDESGNFYYINSNDGLVYVYDLDTGKTEPWCDPRNLKYEGKNSETNKMEYYSDFVPVQVFYDRFSDKLILNGYYSTVASPGKSPMSDQMYNVLYDITDGNIKLYCSLIESIRSHNYYYPVHAVIQEVYDDSSLLVRESTGRLHICDINTGKAIRSNISGIYVSDGRLDVIVQKFNNNLYAFEHQTESNGINVTLGYNYTDVLKYDFSKGNFVDLVEDATMHCTRSMGMLPGYYYYYDTEENSFFKYNLKTTMVEKIDLTFTEDKVEIADMGTLTKVNPRFYMIDENTLIFYDYNMSAFRILRENIVKIPEFYPPVFNRDAYFKALDAYDAKNYVKNNTPAPEAPSAGNALPAEITAIIAGNATVVDYASEVETTLTSLVKINSSFLKASTPESYAVCDITGDGTSELIVRYSFGGGAAIICKHNGKWVANYAPDSMVASMSANGYTSFADGAKNGIKKPCFIDGRMMWITVLEMDTSDDDAIKYVHNDTEVSLDEYKTAYDKIKAEEKPIVWNKI